MELIEATITLGTRQSQWMRDLENRALEALVRRSINYAETLRSQVEVATVSERSFSPCGFFTTFSVPENVARLPDAVSEERSIVAATAKFEKRDLFELLLFITPDGRMDFLEGYTFGSEEWDPSYLPALDVS